MKLMHDAVMVAEGRAIGGQPETIHGYKVQPDEVPMTIVSVVHPDYGYPIEKGSFAAWKCCLVEPVIDNV